MGKADSFWFVHWTKGIGVPHFLLMETSSEVRPMSFSFLLFLLMTSKPFEVLSQQEERAGVRLALRKKKKN